jgi:hypothetical protein
MHLRRPTLAGVVVAAAVSLSLLAAGCGGSGGSAGVASAGAASATTTTTDNGLVAFSSCMRANGVPSFPDPQQFPDGSVKLTIHRLGTGDPHFQAAMGTCNHLLPARGGRQNTDQTPTQLADELSFARCMRNHGLTRFPDPKAQGGLTVEMVEAQGIDVHSPAVLRVVQACLPASHGALTLAKVREALGNAG